MPHGAANIQISCEIAKCAGDGFEKMKGEGSPFLQSYSFTVFTLKNFIDMKTQRKLQYEDELFEGFVPLPMLEAKINVLFDMRNRVG